MRRFALCRPVVSCLLLSSLVAHAESRDYLFSEIAQGIYLHQGLNEEMSAANHGDIANSAFIIGHDAVAVIDPGGSVRNGQLLLSAIRSRTSLPVKWVVLTHIHPDHVAAVSVFSDSVDVIAHARYPRALAQRGEFYRDRYPDLFDPDPRKALRQPDKLVTESLQLDLGNRQLLIKAYSTAHTDNDLTVLDSATRTLFVSDLVFAQRTPTLDGSLRGWLDVLSLLASQDHELIVPGHGMPDRWQALVQPQLLYLQRLRAEVSEQIEQGVTLAQAIELSLEQTNEQGWLLFDQVHPRNTTKAYTELEWE